MALARRRPASGGGRVAEGESAKRTGAKRSPRAPDPAKPGDAQIPNISEDQKRRLENHETARKIATVHLKSCLKIAPIFGKYRPKIRGKTSKTSRNIVSKAVPKTFRNQIRNLLNRKAFWRFAL